MVEAFLMRRILIAAGILLLGGCAATPEPVRFPVTPRMATTYAGDEMTITWKAESNLVYTVYYTDAPHGGRPEWKPLPQANGLRGTGRPVTVSDPVGPDSTRRYLLFTGDQKPY
jgi:hypothetical protein